MRSVQVAAIGLIVALVFMLLSYGRDLIIPMVIAVFIWYLINIMADAIGSLRLQRFYFPRPIAFAMALLLIFGGLSLLAGIISRSVNSVVRAAPTYQANVQQIIERFINRYADTFGFSQTTELNQLIANINFSGFLQNIGLTLAGFLGSAGIILVYTLFIFLEQKCFQPKIDRMLQDTAQRRKVRAIFQRIYKDTKTYIGIKTLTSLMTGAISYAIMQSVSLDFALFWALLIFLFNYIPTIGSIVATFFPSALALIQFDSLAPFAVVVIGVTATQIVIGNIVEPRLMGNTLNLSPLVILTALALWGTLWGIPGAILCVPLTVLLAIIFANFEATRPLAIALSKRGELLGYDDDNS